MIWLSLKVKSLPWEKGTCPHHRGIFSSFQESRQWGSTRSTRSSPSLCRRCPPWGKNLEWSWLCGWSNSEYLELLNNDSEQILDDIKAPYQLLLGSVVLKIRISPLHCCDARHRQSSLSTWHLAAEGVQEKDASTLRDHVINGVSCISYKNRSIWECQTIFRGKYCYKKMSIMEPEWSHLLHWHVVLRQRTEELEPDRHICCRFIKIGNLNYAGF